MATTTTIVHLESVDVRRDPDNPGGGILKTTWQANYLLNGLPVSIFTEYIWADLSVPLDQDDWDTIWTGALATMAAVSGGGPLSTINPVVLAP